MVSSNLTVAERVLALCRSSDFDGVFVCLGLRVLSISALIFGRTRGPARHGFQFVFFHLRKPVIRSSRICFLIVCVSCRISVYSGVFAVREAAESNASTSSISQCFPDQDSGTGLATILHRARLLEYRPHTHSNKIRHRFLLQLPQTRSGSIAHVCKYSTCLRQGCFLVMVAPCICGSGARTATGQALHMLRSLAGFP